MRLKFHIKTKNASFTYKSTYKQAQIAHIEIKKHF